MMLIFRLSWPHLLRPTGRRRCTRRAQERLGKAAAYGFGWGIGAIMFGYGVTMAGMSVGFATIMGINTAVGSLLPFLGEVATPIFSRQADR